MTNESPKRALINYLEFLKSSGYLYLEGEGAVLPDVSSMKSRSAPQPVQQNLHESPEPQPIRPAPSGAPKQTQSRPVRTKPVTQEADLFGKPANEADTPSAPDDKPNPLADAPSLSREERTAQLQDGARRVDACRECALGAQRNKSVYSDGGPEARIVFVGEAPGAEEDATGIPFVGRAGQLLNKMLAAMGFEREEVYICNTLKCRPPGNRDPLPSEKDACEHFLIEQLRILQPDILVALGAHAAQYLCASDLTIGRLRGNWHSFHGLAVRATYHPAFLLRSPSYKAKAWEDYQAIHARYCEHHPDDQRKIWTKGG